MLNAAMIENNRVVNVIYIDESNMELFNAQGMELLDSEPLGLSIGDYREGESWYRDMEGQKVELPVPVEPISPTYTELLEAIKILGVNLNDDTGTSA